MSVTIEIAGIKATIKNREWRSKNKLLEKFLSVYVDTELYSPFLDLTIAENVVEKFDGKILEVKDKPKFVKGRIY